MLIVNKLFKRWPFFSLLLADQIFVTKDWSHDRPTAEL